MLQESNTQVIIKQQSQEFPDIEFKKNGVFVDIENAMRQTGDFYFFSFSLSFLQRYIDFGTIFSHFKPFFIQMELALIN
jgi:hypothetical protein